MHKVEIKLNKNCTDGSIIVDGTDINCDSIVVEADVYRGLRVNLSIVIDEADIDVDTDDVFINRCRFSDKLRDKLQKFINDYIGKFLPTKG